MIIKFEDIQENWKEYDKIVFHSLISFYITKTLKLRLNTRAEKTKIIVYGFNNKEYILNPKYLLQDDVLRHLTYYNSEWFILDNIGHPCPLPKDLFILKTRETLVIKNKEITKELIELGYKYIYLSVRNTDNIFVSKIKPSKKENHYYVESMQSRDKLFIAPFASNPHNLKWDASLTELENLL